MCLVCNGNLELVSFASSHASSVFQPLLGPICFESTSNLVCLDSCALGLSWLVVTCNPRHVFSGLNRGCGSFASFQTCFCAWRICLIHLCPCQNPPPPPLPHPPGPPPPGWGGQLKAICLELYQSGQARLERAADRPGLRVGGPVPSNYCGISNQIVPALQLSLSLHEREGGKGGGGQFEAICRELHAAQPA